MNKKRIFLLLSLLMVLLLASCAVNTSYPGTVNIVEASKVLEDMKSDPKVVVIDARGQESYDKGHLEGSICLSPTELVTDNPVEMSIAPKNQIEKVLSSKGISNESIIYIYDNNQGVSASRIWWTLKVYGHEKAMVVNNGEKALVAAKAPLTAEATMLEAAVYSAKEADNSMIASYDEVAALANTPSEGTIILDVRSQAEYDAGHIPGAVLYPHSRNLYRDGSFMSSRDLGLFYKEEGIEKTDNIIIYCKSSFRATQTYALLQEAGYENLKIYDGAWLEWEAKGGESSTPEDVAPVGPSDGS